MTVQSTLVEIACDESGFSGTNLLDPASPVITHASVDLAVPDAADVVAVLQSRLRTRDEYKSHHLLRPEQRPALEWLLTTLRGRAHVHVIDKTGYVAARVLDLFTEEPSYAAGTSLGRDHSDSVLALRRWTGFLAAFVELTRTKRVRRIDHDAIDRFVATMPTDLPALRAVTRAQVEQVMVRLIDEDPAVPPPLEPLVPALAETLLFWSAGERSVAVVHDEQSALTPGRVARLGTFLAEAVSPAPPPLRSFLQVDSRDDPRVQVADLLAGIARRRTPELNELLAPYLQARPTCSSTSALAPIRSGIEKRHDVVGPSLSAEGRHRVEPRASKGSPRMTATKATNESDGFSAEERAAMKQRAAELRAEGKKGAKKADGLQAVLDAIAKMAPEDRVLAERVHVAVTSTAPELSPKTWYGMPAYANADGKVVVFFQDSGKFGYRYSTLGFQDAAHLDDGDLWPVSYALVQWSPAVEARVIDLVKAATASDL